MMTRELAPKTEADHESAFFRAMDWLRASADQIEAAVERRRAEVAARTGLADRELADALANELILLAAEKSALIAAGVAMPLSLPLLGPILTTLLVVPAGAFWVTINETELCYALACAYRVRMPEEKLRLASFWLVRLSNYDDLRAKALRMGVTLTVRKLVEKLIAAGLARAIATGGARMMMRMMGSAATPWYVKATAFLGVPVLTVLAWRDTLSVGQRALEYFADRHVELPPSDAGASHFG